MLNKVKQALRIASSVTAYDDELTDLIDAALADMGITDIDASLLTTETSNKLIQQAVITYCKCNFGTPDEKAYERIKASYDEQKAQMLMATGYRG